MLQDGRLGLRDGRTLAWRAYGPESGIPVLRFQGTPGSRLSRHPHEESYVRLGARVVVADRPGYGESTRLPGRGVAAVAADAVALLDHLGLGAVRVIGASGGGPHALAMAALHPDRVVAASVVVGSAPEVETEAEGMIGLNRAGWYAARQGWEAMRDLLTPVRDALLRDPLAGLREAMATAPASDQAVMDDPAWQRVVSEDFREALRPGVEGWVDEAMALQSAWDFDPAAMRTTLTWWHGEHDANCPISAVRRLIQAVPHADLRVWGEGGHLEAYHRHDEILDELLSRPRR